MAKNSTTYTKTNLKNMVLGLVTRNNHDGTSKTNTACQPRETIVSDRNFKDLPQNKVNQKELPQ